MNKWLFPHSIVTFIRKTEAHINVTVCSLNSIILVWYWLQDLSSQMQALREPFLLLPDHFFLSELASSLLQIKIKQEISGDSELKGLLWDGCQPQQLTAVELRGQLWGVKAKAVGLNPKTCSKFIVRSKPFVTWRQKHHEARLIMTVCQSPLLQQHAPTPHTAPTVNCPSIR